MAVDKLISITVTDRHEAVYYDGDGKFLFTKPVDALAIMHEAESGHRMVVGLELSEGYHDICNESANFAGLVRKGASDEEIHNAYGCFVSSKNDNISFAEFEKLPIDREALN